MSGMQFGIVPSNIQSAVLQSDFAKTNDTLAAVTDLTLNLEAGRWYEISGNFYFDGGGTGITANLNGGTSTVTGIVGESITFVDSVAYIYPVNLLTSELGVGGPASLFSGLRLAFVVTVQVNEGGTLIPKFAQATTDASASTLLKYSTIQAIDVTP